MIDTHAHLDALEDAAGAIVRAKAAGVDRIVAIGTGVMSARATLEIGANEPGVHVALGIHPHQADDDEPLEEIARLARADAVAIGEIGLDYYRDYAPRHAQRKVFADQLNLATEFGKAVIVHSRAADKDTADMLEDFGGTVVLHCFSSPPLLPVALERGYYVSFAGNVTYPKAADLRAAAAEVPSDRLLSETDCPYLAPQPVRGRTNEPAYVVHTIAALADIRGDETTNLARQLAANAVAAFGLP